MRISCLSTKRGFPLALVGLLGIGLLAISPPASADKSAGKGSAKASGNATDKATDKSPEKDEFQLHYQAAIQLYKKENFEQALAEFQKAYELDALPRLLYNIGQLHRKLGHGKQAVEAYEQYLRTDTDLSPKQREELQHVINDLRGSDPALEPAPAPLLPVEPPPPPEKGKAGRFMANFGIGGAFGLNYPQLEGALQIEAGYSILKNGNGYLIVPVQFHLSGNLRLIMVPVGFQYDFKLPVSGLYLGVRGSVGYAVGFADGMSAPYVANGSQLSHWGLVIPEANVKYVINGRVNLGFQPVSFPLLFGPNGVVSYYRLMLFGGANF